MAEMEPKMKAGGIVLTLIIIAVLGLDFVMLKGEGVASGSVSLRSNSTPFVLAISQPGQEHLLEISSYKEGFGGAVEKTLRYRLVDPDGTVVLEDSDITAHKKRFVDFLPSKAGDYVFYVEEKMLIGSGRGTANVSVTVGDRRFISRLMRF